MRTGKVLMNMPSARSAPAPPCRRPNSTVPKTTSRWPVIRASTIAQARWNKVAVPTPCRRDCWRRLWARPASRATRVSRMREPSPCTFSRPKGAVGSSTSPSIAEKKASCSAWLRPRRACATNRRNGTGLGSVFSRPSRITAASSTNSSRVVWSSTRWWQGSCSNQRPCSGSCAATARINGAWRTSILKSLERTCALSRSAASAPSIAGSHSSASGACRCTTCTGTGRPSHSTAVRRMSWRAIVRPTVSIKLRRPASVSKLMALCMM
ncbi:hypothetical protein D3C71_1305030 [compost metagenome]